MPVGYSRQSASNIVAGLTASAADLNNEFNQLESAFSSSSGHNHDGTAFGGAKIDMANSVTGALAVANGGTGATDATNARANLGMVIGTNVQAQDALLESISGLTTAADEMIYLTATDTVSVASLTSYARTLLDDVDASTARTTLGLVLGTDVQAQSSRLQDIVDLGLTGVLSITSGATVVSREITGTTNEIAVANGDDDSGDPVISFPSTVSFNSKTVDCTSAIMNFTSASMDLTSASITYPTTVDLTASTVLLPDTIEDQEFEGQFQINDGSNVSLVISDQADGLVHRIVRNATSAGNITVLNLDATSRTTPANNDSVTLTLRTENSVGDLQGIAQIRGEVTDITDGSETGELKLRTVQSGAISTKVTVSNGVVVGGATGGDKGFGSVNAKSIYDDNSQITPDYVLEYANTGHINYTALKDDEQAAAIQFYEKSGRFMTLDTYAEFWKNKNHLPAFNSRNDVLASKGQSLGEKVRNLIETVETQAVLIEELHTKLKQMEAANA